MSNSKSSQDKEEKKEMPNRNVRSKNKRRGPKSNDRRESNVKFDKNKNDIAWYSKNSNLVTAAASLPYGMPVGINYRPNSGMNLYTGQIISATYVMGPGFATDQTSPVNIMAANLYSFIRHANSGHANYDKSDLVMYLLALDEVYAHVYEGIRAYGTMFAYANQHRSLPVELVRRLGFNYADLAHKLPNLRYGINAAVARINALAMPAGMPYFTRHQWMTSGIYHDGNLAKDTIYFYKKAGYRVYNETSSDKGGFLKWKTSPALWFVDDYITSLNEMINALIGSEDIGIISGDILKAFGGNLITLPTIDENYTVNVLYSPEILDQFANSTAVGTMHNLDITQKPGINESDIYYHPTTNRIPVSTVGTELKASELENFSDFTHPLFGRQVFCLNGDNIAPAANMIISRLTTAFEERASTEDTGFAITNCGTEIIDHYTITDSNAVAGENPSEYENATTTDFTSYIDTALSNSKSLNLLLYRLMQADYRPSVYLGTGVTVNQDANLEVRVTDARLFRTLNNFTFVSNTALKAMHETALLSEFNVPITGSDSTNK